jgi:competence protein ComEC
MTRASLFGPAIDTMLLQQRQNWPCWLAIGLGVGILVYFSLPVEPPVWLAILAVVACGTALGAACLRPRLRPLIWPALVLGVINLGFAAAVLRTAGMSPHFLSEPVQGAIVSGRILQVEPLPAGARLTLDPAYLGRDLASHPLRLQVTVLMGETDLSPGDWVRLRADVHPPSGPAIPGAFDFRRQAFFTGIDGVGFSYAARLLDPARIGADSRSGSWLGDWADRLRQKIGLRIAEVLPDESGALAIALVVGNQTALRKADMTAMRDSGLSHLLSISGLHISLAAGLMFFSTRFLLALCPPLALRIPTKKWAAVLALAGATFYAILAGAAAPSLAGSVVPTQRSLLMVLIAFGAILLDRSPISLRLVAWSAVALLLWQPESLVGPSFQMSFAAVFALIASFEALRPKLLVLRQFLTSPGVDLSGRVLGYGGQALLWLLTLALSSLIASLATAPFGLYHFDRLQVYGIAANMLAVPLTGLWLMPAAVLALLLMPLGLDAPFLQLLGWGCEVILWIARDVQHWPQAVIAVPAMPAWGLLAASAGLVWICLGSGWNRLAGLLGGVAMLLAIATNKLPDILISESGRLLAMQDPAGQLVVSSNRTERRIRETWLRRQAQAKSASFEQSAQQSSWLSCTYSDNCRVQIKKHQVVFDLGRVSADIACEGADLIIVPQRHIACDRTNAELEPIIIDRKNATATGAIAIFIDDQEIYVDTTMQSVGKRPWSAFAAMSTNDDAIDAAGDGNADFDQ